MLGLHHVFMHTPRCIVCVIRNAGGFYAAFGQCIAEMAETVVFEGLPAESVTREVAGRIVAETECSLLFQCAYYGVVHRRHCRRCWCDSRRKHLQTNVAKPYILDYSERHGIIHNLSQFVLLPMESGSKSSRKNSSPSSNL